MRKYSVYIIVLALFGAALLLRPRSGAAASDPGDFSPWLKTPGTAAWLEKAKQGDPEAQFRVGLALISSNLIRFSSRAPYLSSIPWVGARFRHSSYSLDNSLSPERTAEAYRWIKQAADQRFAPAEEAEKLFLGRVPPPAALETTGPSTDGRRIDE